MEISNSHLATKCSGGRYVCICSKVTPRKKVLLDTISDEHSDNADTKTSAFVH